METKTGKRSLARAARAPRLQVDTGRSERVTRLLAQETITAADVLALPPDERDAVLAVLAEEAAADYRDNTDLTEFTRALAGDDFLDY